MRITARFFVAILALLAAVGLAVAVLIATPSNPLTLLALMGIALVVAIVAMWPAVP